MRSSTAAASLTVLLSLAACSESPTVPGQEAPPSLAVLAASAGDEINTFVDWNGSGDADGLGGFRAFSMGQTFTAIGSGKLESFSFWLEGQGTGESLLFNAYVVQWDGNAPIGPVLFQAGPFEGVSGPRGTFVRFDFDTHGLALAPGTQYLAVLIPDATSGNGGNGLGFVGEDYPGGTGVGGLNNQPDQDLPSDVDQWFTFPGDMAFIAVFGPADPATPDDCKNGGWEAFGFRNQGQCIRFVNTGKDSRQQG